MKKNLLGTLKKIIEPLKPKKNTAVSSHKSWTEAYKDAESSAQRTGFSQMVVKSPNGTYLRIDRGGDFNQAVNIATALGFSVVTDITVLRG